jgi:hypothetical protein
MQRRSIALVAALLAHASNACSANEESRVAPQRSAIVYDGDGRQELFEVDDLAVRARVESSLVAFIPRELVQLQDGRVVIAAPSLAERDGVCADDRFAQQPAAAVCSGVLVDWDLVLTASHCVQAFRVDQLVVAFGYAYRAPGELALSPGDLYEPVEVVDRALQSEDGRSSLDYAFVRLAHAVDPPHAPAPVRMSIASAAAGSALVSAAASESVPIKIDRGGTVQQGRLEQRDHFVADTDTAEGGSGGAAFDARLALLGVLFRGGEDFVADGSCERTNRATRADAAELFTYAARAVSDLCALHPDASSLCRHDCGDPCAAQAPQDAAASCALCARPTGRNAPCWFAIGAALVLARGRRFSRRRCR